MTISEFPEIIDFTDQYGVYCSKSDIFQTFLRWVFSLLSIWCFEVIGPVTLN